MKAVETPFTLNLDMYTTNATGIWLLIYLLMMKMFIVVFMLDLIRRQESLKMEFHQERRFFPDH